MHSLLRSAVVLSYERLVRLSLQYPQTAFGYSPSPSQCRCVGLHFCHFRFCQLPAEVKCSPVGWVFAI